MNPEHDPEQKLHLQFNPIARQERVFQMILQNSELHSASLFMSCNNLRMATILQEKLYLWYISHGYDIVEGYSNFVYYP